MEALARCRAQRERENLDGDDATSYRCRRCGLPKRGHTCLALLGGDSTLLAAAAMGRAAEDDGSQQEPGVDEGLGMAELQEESDGYGVTTLAPSALLALPACMPHYSAVERNIMQVRTPRA